MLHMRSSRVLYLSLSRARDDSGCLISMLNQLGSSHCHITFVTNTCKRHATQMIANQMSMATSIQVWNMKSRSATLTAHPNRATTSIHWASLYCCFIRPLKNWIRRTTQRHLQLRHDDRGLLLHIGNTKPHDYIYLRPPTTKTIQVQHQYAAAKRTHCNGMCPNHLIISHAAAHTLGPCFLREEIDADERDRIER